MSGSYIIIGVHGLRNKPPAEVLANWWQSSILEGLQKNENRTAGVGNISFELVYWADWGYEQPLSKSEDPDSYIPVEGQGPLPKYEDSFWDELRSEASDWIDNPLDWAKQTFGFGVAADTVLRLKLQDLARYYNEPPKRELLRSRLEDILLKHAKKRIMLIAHSMGSIIAYDVLRKLGREEVALAIDHFVTIGSPLGLPHVKYRIYQENDLVRTPSMVRRWTNLSDRRDPVAVDTHLARDYEANARKIKVEDDLVINGYQNPQGKRDFHKSYGYLRAPELSRLIRAFI